MNVEPSADAGAELPAELCSLVEGCIAGRTPAVRAFVERFQGPIFGLCYRMLAHRQDAEDMAQESLLRALRSLNHWDRTRDILPWLFTIAGNRCRTLLQQRKRRATGELATELVADEPDHETERRDWQEELHVALAALRPDYRRAFTLFYERELPYDQIAAQLQVPLGTVKTWIHRARKEIIEHLRQRDALPRTAAVETSE